MTRLPVYCSHGADHYAAWIVTGPRGAYTACQQHLEAVTRKAGPNPVLEAAHQPPGHDPPSQDEQTALF